ncbi:MAG: type II toxin-antitoxin system HicA family toxin [Candidatus Diapherotrites archaeon]|uniref:Type II toxin-antitoxin system HicA family toxin n=1 Tax=Candidatus Iainarchaeum sp. TaxID=3101447 RepID=A0A7J4L0U9_9ARCH|nr:type II toxin-antitoxin system HicA family toxin [Candidatus Diapherotrites archaeon]HIH33276.1 type II toxin-antitoxin system HicA family toxin [Candidatus Diapherotrites archaeon]
MPKLKPVSGKELVKKLAKIGYFIDHQTGSHFILRLKLAPYRRITVPNHKEIAKGTLRAIIRELGLSRQEFEELVEK